MFDCVDDVRRFLRNFAKTPPYSELEAEWKINRYYLWQICNKATYTPPQWVLRRLGIVKYKRRNRRAINLDNPESAAASIRQHATPEFINKLIEELNDDPHL
jgi:hypothetical protein